MEWRNRTTKRKRLSKKWETGGFLNWYKFAYGNRDTVNQLGKIVPGVIKNVSAEINNIAQQAISQGGKNLERALLKILKGVTEDVYQKLFRFLGNFGKNQFQKINNKILK